jgi:hypothetical protein
MAISNSVVRGGGRNRGVVSAGGDKILPPIFRLREGARAISMVVAAHAGVDHFWLMGARDEGGSGDITDSSIPLGPGRRCFEQCAGQHRLAPGIQSMDSWLPMAWFNFLQATNRAPNVGLEG